MSLTLALIALTCVVSFLAFGRPALMQQLILWPPAIARRGEYWRLLSYGLIHADAGHLFFNMVTLYFFGRAMEPLFVARIGPAGYLGFYAGALLASILPTYLRNRDNPDYHSLGASGAVSAVLFAFILLQPWALIFVFFLPVPSIVYAVLYIGYSIWMDRRGTDNVNHSAHLWGAVYGMLFTVMMEPRVASTFLARLASPSFG